MAKRKVIVKRLSSIQDLGTMEILCTDKTGTLTEGKIKLLKSVDPKGNESSSVFELAYINSSFETGVRSPLDDAILEKGKIDIASWQKLDEVPFDFERRRVSVLAEHKGRRMLIVKGAPEDILQICTKYYCDSSIENLNEITRKQINKLFESMSQEGFRVLGIAHRYFDEAHEHAVISDEVELVFSGFVAFLDPPKDSASKIIEALNRDGVELKVITGDHELVTRHICNTLRINITGILTGAELAKLSDEALRIRVQQANLFCRINPAQKNRILVALKTSGKVVGFLGDGINDAPALHTADVGISVDGAVDVAKQSADMVLLEHNLAVLHEGIRAGRSAFMNVRKYILMATSSNFGNMFSMALSTLFLPFLPMLPVQILLNNFLYDLSELAIPLDNVEEKVFSAPPKTDISFIRNFMLTIGPVSSAFDFITFFIMLRMFQSNAELFHTGWFIESLATQVLVIFIIRTRLNPLRSQPGPWLVIASGVVLLIAIVLTLLPIHVFLGFLPLPFKFYCLLFVIVITYLRAVEFVKGIFYHFYFKHA